MTQPKAPEPKWPVALLKTIHERDEALALVAQLDRRIEVVRETLRLWEHSPELSERAIALSLRKRMDATE